MSDFTLIKRYSNSMLAHLDKVKLESEGIDCFLQDENMVTLRPYLSFALSEIKLFVNNFDSGRAISILQLNEMQELKEIYPNERLTSATCPKCESVEIIHPTSLLALFIFLFVGAPPFIENPMKNMCKRCGFKWKSN